VGDGFAQLFGKLFLPRVVESLLTAKKQDFILCKHILDRGNGVLVEGLGQIDAANFRAYPAGDGKDIERGVGCILMDLMYCAHFLLLVLSVMIAVWVNSRGQKALKSWFSGWRQSPGDRPPPR